MVTINDVKRIATLSWAPVMSVLTLDITVRVLRCLYRNNPCCVRQIHILMLFGLYILLAFNIFYFYGFTPKRRPVESITVRRQRMCRVGQVNPECVVCQVKQPNQIQCECGRYICHECAFQWWRETDKRVCPMCGKKRVLYTPLEKAIRHYGWDIHTKNLSYKQLEIIYDALDNVHKIHA